MPISTKSIIHYTKSIDFLKLILLEGFKIKYCAEDLFYGEEEAHRAAHPMVCFCDIPLALSFSSKWTYGNYAIGIRKYWAYKKNINPVLYLEKNSSLTKAVSGLLEFRKNNIADLATQDKLNIIRLKCFAKNYKGYNSYLKKKDYCFYDEREWRYVPKKREIANNLLQVSYDNYSNNKDLYNQKLDEFRLTFDIADISFIIVDKQVNIKPMIEFLKTEYKTKLNKTETEIDYLISKIISAERIKKDFSIV